MTTTRGIHQMYTSCIHLMYLTYTQCSIVHVYNLLHLRKGCFILIRESSLFFQTATGSPMSLWIDENRSLTSNESSRYNHSWLSLHFSYIDKRFHVFQTTRKALLK